MRQVLLTFGRGLVYALAFWLVYSIFYQPPWRTDEAADQNEARAERYWSIVEGQQVRNDRLLVVSEQQQKRMDAVMAKQEELSQRFETVIARWEKQVGIKRPPSGD